MISFRRLLSLRNAGVLGMNRRNAEYIMRFNPRRSFSLVDDKLLTKQLALKHGIPTPPLLSVVLYHGDIAGLDNLFSHQRQFVLKPARGSEGGGKTTDGVRRSAVITRHPDTGELLRGIEVPYWEKMLLMAAQSAEMTGLGYIGVDLVIDKDQGPLLLELNARPGLQIQIANKKGLLECLEMVDRAPEEILHSPEKRVFWVIQNFP